MEQARYMDSGELAKLLLMSRGAVHTLVSRRQIPHLKVGHRLLFDRAEIATWLEGHTRLTAEEALGHREAVEA
jgi:excisionase family DNA binding protein